jgi:hypothetical protein
MSGGGVWPQGPQGYVCRVLGEFFALRPGEDVGPYIEDGPWERTHTVEAKTLSEVSIGTLAALLGIDEEVGEQQVYGEGDESGAFPLPDSFRDAVVSGVPEDVVVKWAASEEMEADHWTAGLARETLTELQSLARQAQGDGRSLWFYWSV